MKPFEFVGVSIVFGLEQRSHNPHVGGSSPSPATSDCQIKILLSKPVHRLNFCQVLFYKFAKLLCFMLTNSSEQYGTNRV